MPKQGFLSGYKTYITGVFGIVAASAAYAIGEPVAGQEVLSGTEFLTFAFIGFLGIFQRMGIDKNGGGK